MKKLIATVGIAVGVLTTAVAYAETPKLIGSMDYISGTLHIDGQISSADKYVSANMLVLGITPQDAENAADIGSNIVYSGETITDEDGTFSFDVKFDQNLPEGTYDLYFGSEAFDSTEHYPVYFSSAETYRSKINELNGKNEYSDFKNWLDTDNGAEKIGFNKYESLADKDTAAKMVYNYAKTKGFSTANATVNNSVFASGYYASLIKNNISPTNGWVEEILLQDSNIADLYNKYGDKNLTYFLQKLNKDSATPEEFEKNILDALILTVVKYPNGNDNIKTVFERYSTYLGANTTAASLDKYAAIAGNDYASVAACVQAFNASAAGKPSYGGGGGGSTGSSGSSGGGVFAGASANITNELGIKFNDLNPVPWAYKAISVLYEKGIVSGKSEESFCPNDTVTREEFAKMLVCAAGLQDNAVTGNAFSDAVSDAWYTKYINIAYDNGICRGIGDGMFGVGRTVTREDMCVMVYNSLRKLSVNCPEAELKFNDEADFNGYSKAAVASLADIGIVNGTGEGVFEPKGNATRAQAAVIICNVITNIN